MMILYYTYKYSTKNVPLLFNCHYVNTPFGLSCLPFVLLCARILNPLKDMWFLCAPSLPPLFSLHPSIIIIRIQCCRCVRTG